MAATHTAATCACSDHRTAGPTKLADHAATAALYVTDPERKRAARGHQESVHQLTNPASPIPPGLTLASASAAASLAAHSHQKSLDSWKQPETQQHAAKAASLARRYQSPDQIAPTTSTTNVGPVYPSTSPPQSSPLQGSGRNLAGRVALLQDSTTGKIHPGALNAATGAALGRQRAESAPVKPQQHPAAAFALSAAVISHQASQAQPVLDNLDPALEAARIHHVARFNAKMYTSTPPVSLEVAEQKQKDTLRAAAISMAKDMYAKASSTKEDSPSEGADAARLAAKNRGHLRHHSESHYSWTAGEEVAAGSTRPYVNLHEAAQKIAAEKLARMRQGEQGASQQFYGGNTQAHHHPRSRRSIVGKLRRRTSSESDISSLDWERSMEIRNQMSSLQSRLYQVNDHKARDRAELMEIARRNVTAAIQEMDEQVYARTGKPSPSMQREWEEKAEERARAEGEARRSNFRNGNSGGQKSPKEVDVEAIARARIQPMLNDIDDRVEERRARDLEAKLDQERKQALQRQERQREHDLKIEQKRQKATEKQALREEKALAAQEGRHERPETSGLWSKIFKGYRHDEENEREARPESAGSAAAQEPHDYGEAHSVADVNPPQENNDLSMEPQHDKPEEVHSATTRLPALPMTLATGTATGDTETIATGDKHPKSDSKLKGWFTTRSSSKPYISQPTPVDPSSVPVDTDDAIEEDNRSAPSASNPVPDGNRGARPVEPASELGNDAYQPPISTDRPQRLANSRSRLRMSISNILTRKSLEKGAHSRGMISPLESSTAPTSRGRGRDVDSFRTNHGGREEQHDDLDDEQLPLPPQLQQITARGSSNPGLNSRFSEDL